MQLRANDLPIRFPSPAPFSIRSLRSRFHTIVIRQPPEIADLWPFSAPGFPHWFDFSNPGPFHQSFRLSPFELSIACTPVAAAVDTGSKSGQVCLHGLPRVGKVVGGSGRDGR